MFKSSDNGKTWENKSNGLKNGKVACIAINSRNVLFCGLSSKGGSYMHGSNSLGVFRSTNYGETWEVVYVTIWVNSIYIDKNDDIFVCGNTFNLITDVVISRDNGNKWEKIENGLPDEFITNMIYDDLGNFYINRFEGGLYHSNDKGNSWNLMRSRFNNIRIKYIVVNSIGVLFIAIDEEGLFQSTDKGGTWEKTNFKLDNNNYSNQFTGLCIDKQDNLFLSVYQMGIYNSKDGGNNWQCIGDTSINLLSSLIGIDNQGYLYANKSIPGKPAWFDDDGEAVYLPGSPSTYVLYRSISHYK